MFSGSGGALHCAKVGGGWKSLFDSKRFKQLFFPLKVEPNFLLSPFESNHLLVSVKRCTGRAQNICCIFLQDSQTKIYFYTSWFPSFRDEIMNMNFQINVKLREGSEEEAEHLADDGNSSMVRISNFTSNQQLSTLPYCLCRYLVPAWVFTQPNSTQS